MVVLAGICHGVVPWYDFSFNQQRIRVVLYIFLGRQFIVQGLRLDALFREPRWLSIFDRFHIGQLQIRAGRGDAYLATSQVFLFAHSARQRCPKGRSCKQ